MADLPLEATAFLILFARVGAVLMLLPLLSEESIPGQVRLLLALGLTLALFPLLRPQVAELAGQGDAALVGVILSELLTGLAMGMIIRLMFQAATMAGALISLQVGLTSALTVDPMGGQTPLLGKLMALAAALICFASGLHHHWIAGVVRSYGLFPAGSLPDPASWTTLAVDTIAQSLSLAVSLAAPFILYGMVFNIAVGFGARLAPALQLFFIAQPLNLLLGLALFAATAGVILSTFADRFVGWMAGGWAGG